MIKKSSIELIQDLNIEDVIKHFVKVENKKVCCPFHGERTPSLSISTSKNMWKCFGCSKAGNGISFVMELEKIGFMDAVKFLSNTFKITLEYEGEYDKEKWKVYKEKMDTNIKVLNFVHGLYKNAPVNNATEYMVNRNFDAYIMQDWGLLYAPDSYDFISKILLEKGISTTAQELGLLCKTQNGLKDNYRNRLLIPIQDEGGTLVGLAARRLDNEKEYKYLNPSDCEPYNKSKILFGMHRAKRAIKEENQIILVEGYLDVIRLHSIGVCNAVAPCGTALTDEQIKLIKRHTNNVTLWYDGDEAGIKACKKNTPLLLKAGLVVTIISLEGIDPDDWGKLNTPKK
jgi:DNA primase